MISNPRNRLRGVMSLANVVVLSGCSLMVAQEEVVQGDELSANPANSSMGGDSPMATGGSDVSDGGASTGGQAAMTGGESATTGGASGGSDMGSGGSATGGAQPSTGGADPGTGGADPGCTALTLFETSFDSRYEASAGAWTDSTVAYTDVEDGSYKCSQKAAACSMPITLEQNPSANAVQLFELEVQLNRSVNRSEIVLSQMGSEDISVLLTGAGLLTLGWGTVLQIAEQASFVETATVSLLLEIDPMNKSLEARVEDTAGTVLTSTSYVTDGIDYGSATKITASVMHANVDAVPQANWLEIHETCPSVAAP